MSGSPPSPGPSGTATLPSFATTRPWNGLASRSNEQSVRTGHQAPRLHSGAGTRGSPVRNRHCAVPGGTQNAFARAAISSIAEGPPILMTLGCATSTASASNWARKSCRPAAFSPAAIGTPPSRRTRAQARVVARGRDRLLQPGKIELTACGAPCRSPATLSTGSYVSTISLASGPIACRAAPLGTVISCSLMSRYPRPIARSHAAATMPASP